jgi:hypothetical protein
VSGKAVTILNFLRLQFLCHLCGKHKKISTQDNLDIGEIPKKNVIQDDSLENEIANRYPSWKAVAEEYDQVMMHYFYFIAFLQWIIFIVIVTAWKGQCT